MNGDIWKNRLNLYGCYLQIWRFLFCCLEVAAGLPFLVAGFLVRFAREWFLIGGGLYDFLKEMNQRTKQRGVNQ